MKPTKFIYLKLLIKSYHLKFYDKIFVLFFTILITIFFVIQNYDSLFRIEGIRTWSVWADQSHYLNMARQISEAAFDKNDYTYGLGFPILGVPLSFFNVLNPFSIVNILLFFWIIYFTYIGLNNVFPCYITLPSILCLLIFLPFSEFIIKVPWNNSVTIFAFAVLFHISFSRKYLNRKDIIVISLLIGWVFASRYIDALFLIILILPICYRTLITHMHNPKKLLKLTYPGLSIGFLFISSVLYSHQYYFGHFLDSPYKKYHLSDKNGETLSDQDFKRYDFKSSISHLYGVFVDSNGWSNSDRINYTKSLFEYFPMLYFSITGIILLFFNLSNKRTELYFLLINVLFVIFFYSAYYLKPENLKYGAYRYVALYYPFLVSLSFYGLYSIIEFLISIKSKAKHLIYGTFLIISAFFILYLIIDHFNFKFYFMEKYFLMAGMEIPNNKITFESNKNAMELNKLIDGNLYTRWTTNHPQEKGDYLSIKFIEPYNIKMIILDIAKSPHDYPNSFEIQVVKGSEIENVNKYYDKIVNDKLFIFFPNELEINDKMVIRLTNSIKTWYWSIHELTIFGRQIY